MKFPRAHRSLFFAGRAGLCVPAMFLALAGCMGKADREAKSMEPAPAATAPAQAAADEAWDKAPEAPMEEIAAEGALNELGAGVVGGMPMKKKAELARDRPGARGAKGGEGGGGDAPVMRAWFPETFLFEPLIVTDDQGAAQVTVRVPDRLTTWRVLGLAHSRGGAQAGAVTSFLGTLPAYVDPVVPPFLRAGDQVRVPVQFVNTTAEPIAGEVTLEAAGLALAGAATASVTVPAQGNLVRFAALTAGKPGQASFTARFGQADAVTRTVDVLPTGKPVLDTMSGTLARPREFSITGPETAQSGLGRARLLVFPGALAILRAELAAAGTRGGVAQDAFALLLAGKADELLRAFGDEPDPDALRELAIRTTQRVVRHARRLDVVSASLLAEAALSHPDNPVLARLGTRAVQHIEQKQAPDGTCGGESGWTLQRLLVTTADCARAVGTGAPNVVVRASGAFERHAEHIMDPYTAAAVLASGAVPETLAARLRPVIRDAIYERADGSRAVKVSPGVVRADGVVPSEVEATALAVLALQDDPGAPLADLGAAILSAYSPVSGWGDGRTNLACMQATLRLFKDPVPENVVVTLMRDGQEVARGTLDRDRIREVLVLEVADLDSRGAHAWRVSAEPAVPGLGFSMAVTSFVPWPREPVESGLELAVIPPARPVVGQASELAIRAAAPSGYPLRITLALPAGVQVEPADLDALVQQSVITRYELAERALVLHAASLAPAQMFKATLRVIPTLAGTLQSGASSLAVHTGGRAIETHAPPAPWVIR